ncbi:hypothetical protein QYM36_003558 [Artemia franciscana]|uniref:Uncharacterized protein n=1 Tax=Artemia franciscana TaxID=6661 RepID=A0AA88I6R2_ARTSF|nr:hypothetical protein QYM36_003558 [Artemia franciscana]
MSTMNSSAIKVPFKNDGSFLEMFKKMQEEQKKLMSDDPATEQKNDLKNKNEKKLVDKAGVATPPLPIVGKRKANKVLPTGIVKKQKTIENEMVSSQVFIICNLFLMLIKLEEI